jgi:hypothetical protein
MDPEIINILKIKESHLWALLHIYKGKAILVPSLSIHMMWWLESNMAFLIQEDYGSQNRYNSKLFKLIIMDHRY